jgi:hypothetical protein
LKRFSKPTGEIDIGPLNADVNEDARVTGYTLDQGWQDHLMGLQKFARAERMEILDRHAIDVQGFKGLYVKHRYYDPLERASWLEEVIFVQHKEGELYRLELQCQPDQIERFEPVFAHLVTTFEFDCK